MSVSSATPSRAERRDLKLEELLTELDVANRNLGAAADALGRRIRELEIGMNADGEIPDDALGIGARFQIAIDEELEAISDEAEKKEKRPPAEDIRAARARRRVRERYPELDADHRRIQTEISALKLWLVSQKAVVNAKQSVLNGARAAGA